MTEENNDIKDFPIILDNRNELPFVVGRIHNATPNAKMLVSLLEEGHSFELSPILSDGKLLGISINMSATKKP